MNILSFIFSVVQPIYASNVLVMVIFFNKNEHPIIYIQCRATNLC